MSGLLLATYDPAQSSPSGDYWAWSHQAVPKKIRDEFYYTFLAKASPPQPSQIGPKDCVGGFAQMKDGWNCWYRLFDGGRDQFGRPGRLVICCAFRLSENDAKLDFSKVLFSAAFEEVGRLAKGAPPIPAPADLEVKVAPESVTTIPAISSKILQGEEICIEAPDVAAITGRLSATMPRTGEYHCRLFVCGGVSQLKCSILTRKPVQPSATSTVEQAARMPLSASSPAPRTISLSRNVIMWLLLIAAGLLAARLIVGLLRGKAYENSRHSESMIPLDPFKKVIRKE